MVAGSEPTVEMHPLPPGLADHKNCRWRSFPGSLPPCLPPVSSHLPYQSPPKTAPFLDSS